MDLGAMVRSAMDVPVLEQEDLVSAVRALARGLSPDLSAVEGASMVVREILEALRLPPRGHRANLVPAAMALDLTGPPSRGNPVSLRAMFLGSDAQPPLYPERDPPPEQAWPEHELSPLRGEWDRRIQVDDPSVRAATLERRVTLLRGMDEGTMAVGHRSRRLVLDETCGGRSRGGVALRAFSWEHELDLVDVRITSSEVGLFWNRPGRPYAVSILWAADLGFAMEYLTVRADDPDPLVTALRDTLQTRSYASLLDDIEACSPQSEGFARLVAQIGVASPEAPESRGLAVLLAALRSQVEGVRFAACAGAGFAGWLDLHDEVVRAKGDDSARVRAAAERVAPSLEPRIG